MRKARGFTIIELLVVLVIVSLMVAMAAMVTRAITSQQRRSLTATRMQGVDAALVQFVISQKRLPCPADGSIASTAAGAGAEMARNVGTGCTTDQSMGVVPWVALGLTESDATDGWERRLTYRIATLAAADNAMDMSMCDPASTVNPAVAAAACNVACTAAALGSCTPPQGFLLNKGLEVRGMDGVTKVMNPAGVPATGAAYVVISHGETGGGGYLNSGQQYTSITTDGTEEQKNYANLALRAVPLYYVDAGISDAPGAATHFDDIVSRPSMLSVITKAGLGPRSH